MKNRRRLHAGRWWIWIALGVTSQLFARAAERWSAPELGHIFTTDQQVRLRLSDATATVDWRVTDFWQNEIESGQAKVTEGQAGIEPVVRSPGYYLVRARTAAGEDLYTSFALISPNRFDEARFGVMTHFAQGMNPELLPVLQKIGISSIRDEHYWADVERTPGVYTFSEKSEAYMRACREAGIDPLIALTFGNKLHGEAGGPVTPEECAAYGDYGKAVLDHYGKQIKWLEIWNEYNGSWAPLAATKSLDARCELYTAMLKAAYGKIKTSRPDARVLGGAAVLIPLPYFDGLFRRGALDYLDAVVIHPYRERPEGVDEEIGELRSLIRKYNHGKDKPLWVTETGRPSKAEYDWETGRGMFERGRAEGARYLARMFTLLLSAGVEKIYWYLASDHAEFVSMGLLRHHADEASGMGRYAVAPSYVAYANLIRQLGGKTFTGREAERMYSQARVYKFSGDREEVRVCWATRPARIVVQAPGPLEVTDLMGGTCAVALKDGEATIELTEDALYLRGPITDLREIEDARPVLAAWPDDYSKTQGDRHWFYGYHKLDNASFDTPLDPASFQPLSQVETMWGYEWGSGSGFLKISPGGFHPDKAESETLAPALRWVSPVKAEIHLKAYCKIGGEGDGVTIAVLKDGSRVGTVAVGGAAPAEAGLDLDLSVREGTVVELLCLPNQSTDFDATTLEVVIRGQG